MVQMDYKATNFRWTDMDGERINSSLLLLLPHPQRSTIFPYTTLFRSRLYIMKATVPGNYPAPGLFTESISLRERTGEPTRQEEVQLNVARLDPHEINTGLTRILAADGGAAEEDAEDPEWKRFTSREAQ